MTNMNDEEAFEAQGGVLRRAPEPQGSTTLSVEDLLLQWVNRTLTVEGAKAIRDAAEARAAAPPDIDVERLRQASINIQWPVEDDAVMLGRLLTEYRRLASPDASE